MNEPITVERSPGTILAEKERAKANRLSEAQRERLFDEGMALIYGGAKNFEIEVQNLKTAIADLQATVILQQTAIDELRRDVRRVARKTAWE